MRQARLSPRAACSAPHQSSGICPHRGQSLARAGPFAGIGGAVGARMAGERLRICLPWEPACRRRCGYGAGWRLIDPSLVPYPWLRRPACGFERVGADLAIICLDAPVHPGNVFRHGDHTAGLPCFFACRGTFCGKCSACRRAAGGPRRAASHRGTVRQQHEHDRSHGAPQYGAAAYRAAHAACSAAGRSRRTATFRPAAASLNRRPEKACCRRSGATASSTRRVAPVRRRSSAACRRA